MIRSKEYVPQPSHSILLQVTVGNETDSAVAEEYMCTEIHSITGTYSVLSEWSYFEGSMTYVGCECLKCGIQLKGKESPGIKAYIVSKKNIVRACSMVFKGCRAIYCGPCFEDESATWGRAPRSRARNRRNDE